jgi:uncharacterized protein (DUF2345 family)
MSLAREAVFECTYASPDQVRTGYVRAWDAEEAVELFAEELRMDGVEERGDISVRARKDGPARESAYSPH